MHENDKKISLADPLMTKDPCTGLVHDKQDGQMQIQVPTVAPPENIFLGGVYLPVVCNQGTSAPSFLKVGQTSDGTTIHTPRTDPAYTEDNVAVLDPDRSLGLLGSSMKDVDDREDDLPTQLERILEKCQLLDEEARESDHTAEVRRKNKLDESPAPAEDLDSPGLHLTHEVTGGVTRPVAGVARRGCRGRNDFVSEPSEDEMISKALRNRQAAARSRQRRRMATEDLKKKVLRLEDHLQERSHWRQGQIRAINELRMESWYRRLVIQRMQNLLPKIQLAVQNGTSVSFVLQCDEEQAAAIAPPPMPLSVELCPGDKEVDQIEGHGVKQDCFWDVPYPPPPLLKKVGAVATTSRL